jgi:cell division protein FtsQ
MSSTASPARTRLRTTVPQFDDEDEIDAPRQVERVGGRLGRRGVRLRFRAGVVPRSVWGRVAAASGLVLLLALAAGIFLTGRHFFRHDPRFLIASSDDIQIEGNTHISRAQLLSVFGGDVERNVFSVPLAERQADLDDLPWVQHATVMRLMPDQLRIRVTERTPVAYVRHGTHIGLVDASGVLLDVPLDAPGNPQYSFPVVTGLSADDPISTRAARVQIYQRFMSDLKSIGDAAAQSVSEIDISDPEDLKAVVADPKGEILVHFGAEKFAARYRRFEELLPTWRQQYPKLASVDMRYERQVVLEMKQGGDAADTAASAKTTGGTLASSHAAEAVKEYSTHAANPAAKVASSAGAKTLAAVVKPSSTHATQQAGTTQSRSYTALLPHAGHGPKLPSFQNVPPPASHRVTSSPAAPFPATPGVPPHAKAVPQ